MSKHFLETFPTLKLEKELAELMELVEVLHINYTRDKSAILIYIRSPRLIQKDCIYGLEEQITKQLFGGQDLRAVIIEQYELSEQYTPSTLLDVYQDSILLEFKKNSDLEYNLLRKAKWNFIGEDVLKITMEDTMWAHDRSLDIKHRLDKVFGERCGFSLDIRFEYAEAKTSRLRMEAEEREKLALEVEQTMFMQNAAEEQDKTSDIDTETKALLEDPELMIEFLKKKRGI